MLAFSLPAAADPPNKDLKAIDAVSAILMDAATGTVIFAKKPDIGIPPASLTKLMTLHVVYLAIKAGRISKSDIVLISRTDTARALGWNSSIMNLQEGMRVDVLTLMRGLAVISANDAAYALARTVCGSVELFVAEMNREARAMGFEITRFEEPSGLSGNNATTAAEFALFCRIYLNLHPESLAELHSLKFLDFPLQPHMPPGKIAGTERMKNRNDLVFTFSGCDGLKTGFITESGYNLAVTAERGGTRFIAVLLGGKDITYRFDDARKLLEYGFGNYVTVRPEIMRLSPIRVWGGNPWSVKPVPGTTLAVTAQKSQVRSIVSRIEKKEYAFAPLFRNYPLGTIIFTSGDKVLSRIPLVSAIDAAQSNFMLTVADALQFSLRKILGLENSL